MLKIAKWDLSQQGLEFIQSWEGFSHEPYICAGGHSTIGYGHLIQPNETDYLTHVTHEGATEIMKNDVKWAEDVIHSECDSSVLYHYEFDALVSFVFNLGATCFTASSFYQKLTAYITYKRSLGEKWSGHASDLRLDALWEMVEFIHAGGKPLKGLSRRRATESWMFLKGQYKNNE